MSGPFDFIVDQDRGQRYAYPVTNAGAVWYEQHAGEFDLSELGIEVDTTKEAYDTFVAAVRAAGLRVGVDA